MSDEDVYREDWMTDEQWRCAKLAAEYKHGFHHLSNLRKWGNGVAIDEPNRISTYDFNGLTRLVVMAHDECIRIDIGTETREENYDGYTYEVTKLIITFHPRKRPVAGDRMSSRHPELEAHVSEIRKNRGTA